MTVSIRFFLGALQATLALSLGCIHPPRDYPGKLGSKVQEYFFFKEGLDIHLVMNQRIQSDHELPSEIAWVTPIPALPKHYFEEKESLFRQLFLATDNLKSLRPIRRNSSQAPASATQGFTVHETVYAGKYGITPLEVGDSASGEGINKWLVDNGYHRVPEAGLRYYLKPKACFLAIKVKGLQGKDRTLKPLHVIFHAEEARVPLKFFANAGTFDVYLYLKAKRRPGSFLPQADLETRGFRPDGFTLAEEGLIGKLGVKGLSADSAGIQRFLGKGINTGKNPVSKWPADPLIVME